MKPEPLSETCMPSFALRVAGSSFDLLLGAQHPQGSPPKGQLNLASQHLGW